MDSSVLAFRDCSPISRTTPPARRFAGLPDLASIAEQGYPGYTSYASLDDLPWRMPIFGDLEKALDKHVAAFCKDLGFDLGDKKLMMLRNHGTMSVGGSAAECWMGMFFLERACAQQVQALSAGRENVMMAPDHAQAEVRSQTGGGLGMIAQLAWAGCLRKLDRESPGYAD